jgi:hypothetical protein
MAGQEPAPPASAREWICVDCGAGYETLVRDDAPEIPSRYFWRCGVCGTPSDLPVYGDIAPAEQLPDWFAQIDQELLKRAVAQYLDDEYESDEAAEILADIASNTVVIRADANDPDMVIASVNGEQFAHLHRSDITRPVS